MVSISFEYKLQAINFFAISFLFSSVILSTNLLNWQLLMKKTLYLDKCKLLGPTIQNHQRQEIHFPQTTSKRVRPNVRFQIVRSSTCSIVRTSSQKLWQFRGVSRKRMASKFEFFLQKSICKFLYRSPQY